MDTYSKVVLTIIAATLFSITYQNALAPRPANAFGTECGTAQYSPCYIAITEMPKAYVNVSSPVEIYGSIDTGR